MTETTAATVIYTVSATRCAVASFPGTDCIRVAANRFLPSLKVLLRTPDGRSDVMALPIVPQEVRGADDVEKVRAAIHQKVDKVLDDLLAQLKGTT